MLSRAKKILSLLKHDEEIKAFLDIPKYESTKGTTKSKQDAACAKSNLNMYLNTTVLFNQIDLLSRATINEICFISEWIEIPNLWLQNKISATRLSPYFIILYEHQPISFKGCFKFTFFLQSLFIRGYVNCEWLRHKCVIMIITETTTPTTNQNITYYSAKF